MRDLIEIRKQYSAGLLAKSDYIRTMDSLHRRLHEYPPLLAASSVKSIELNREGVIATLGEMGLKFLLIEGDARIAPLEALNFGGYEEDELAMMVQLTAGAKVMLDVGANIGLHSMHLRKSHPGLRVFAFEPLPRTFAYLNRNLALNAMEDIRTFQLGLSDEAGELRFYFDPKISAAASMRNLSDDASIQEIACPVEKLDDFVARERLQVDFIKCDVEGAELMVLRGASATLDQAQPVVFLEMLRKWAAKFNYHPNDIIDYLQGKGYQCHAVLGDRLVTVPEVTEDTVATNYVFLHGRKHRALAERLVDQKPR